MNIFSFPSFIQRAPPRPKSFHASSSSSAEASSIASHIASVTTRARSHRDASIFRVHSFARSRRRRFVAPFPSSASSTGASISALNCTSATRRDDTTHHRQSASARSTPSSRDRPRVSRRINPNQNHIESIARFVRHERDRTRAPSSGNRSLAHASSTASTTRQSTRATESSMAVDECGRTRAARERTTTTHPHIHDTRIPSTNTYPDINTHNSTMAHQMSEQLPR